MSIVSGIVNVIADTATGLKGALSDTAAKAISEAIEQGGNLTEAITKNAPELLTNDTFMRVATKMGDNLAEIKNLEPSFHAGTGSVDDVLKALDINAGDDIARGFSGLQDTITASMRSTDALADDLGADLASISRPADNAVEATAENSVRQAPTSPEGIRAQEAAARRAAERQAAQEAEELAARELAEKTAREAQEQAAKEAAEQAAKESAEQATKEGAEQSVQSGAEAAVVKPKGNLGKLMMGAAITGAVIPGDTPQTPEERAAEKAATDGNATIQGKEVELSQIPLSLMTDAEFAEHIATLQGPIDPQKMAELRQQEMIDKGFGTLDANGKFQLDQDKWLEARQKFENGIKGNLTAKASGEAALADQKDTPDNGLNGMLGGIQELFNNIVQMIQDFVKMIGGNGGLFGNLQRGGSSNSPQASSQVNTNTNSPTPATPSPTAPQLSPEQRAEQALIQEHRGYAQNTASAISAGSISYAALDTSQIDWQNDEVISGNADIERVLEENLTGKFDGGTGGVLHIDEDEGLLYVTKDANGDAVAYRVNDHINDIPNLNDLAWSNSSLDGFGNVLLANDRQTANFNEQGGLVKTVEFDDSFFDGKDIKNEQLQFHVRLDGQGRHNISVINDDYKQNNGTALTAANGQTNAEIGHEDPGFDYYLAGKDPVQERIYNEQQANARNQEIGNAVGDGIRNAGQMIEGMIGNGMTINVGGDNNGIRMGNRGIPNQVGSNYERLEDNAEANRRTGNINIDL